MISSNLIRFKELLVDRLIEEEEKVILKDLKAQIKIIRRNKLLNKSFQKEKILKLKSLKHQEIRAKSKKSKVTSLGK